MASVTGLTAERMLEIEAASIVDGEVNPSGHLILESHAGDFIDAGKVVGDKGDKGDKGDRGTDGTDGVDGEDGAPGSVAPGHTRIGQSIITAPAGATASSGSYVDSGLTLSLVANGTTRYKFTVTHGTRSAAAARIFVSVLEGAVTVFESLVQQPAVVAIRETRTFNFDLVPTAGSHTYKVAFALAGGAGPITFDAGPTFPASLAIDALIGGGGGGGGSALTVQEEGASLDSGVAQLNFVGAGVTATRPAAGLIDVTIPGQGAPFAHAITHQPGGTDPMAVDASAAIGSLRTLGLGATQAAGGAHSHIGLAGDPGVAMQFDGTASVASTASTSFVGVAGGASGTFIAPRSGKVLIAISGYLKTQTAGIYAHLTWEWTLYPTLPVQGGTALEAFSSQDTGYSKSDRSTLVTGLVPGASYGVRASIASGATSSSASCANTRIVVTPVDTVGQGGGPLPYGSTGVLATIIVGASSNVPITFPAQTDTNYSVVIAGNSVDVTFTVINKTTTGCTVVTRNKDAAAARDPGFTWMVVPSSGPPSGALGQIGYAEVTANSIVNATGILTSAPVDVTGLSVTVNMSSARRYKVVYDGQLFSTVAGDRPAVGIRDGANLICYNSGYALATTTGYPEHVERIMIAPTTGSHTLKVSLGRSSGTGNINVAAGAQYPAFISVEDIGPV